MPGQDAGVPDISGSIGPLGLPGLPDEKLGEIKAVQDVNKIQGKLGNAAQIGHQVKDYQEDLNQLRQGDMGKLQELPDAIESKVENLNEIKSLEKSSEEFAAIKAKWNDPEAVKEQALNKAKETAVNHFVGHEEELKSAMEKLSKLKAKIPDPQGTLDLFAKRQRFMKEKKLVERFVPGIAFQFQKQESYWVDLNPYVGFKVTGRWLAGLGWNERLAYNHNKRSWDTEDRVYGLRSFVHFELKKSIWLKSDVEYMNAPIYAMPLMGSEVEGRDWIWSFFAGFKKDMEISKRCKASVQTLYNIYKPDKKSPYANRLNIRIGFEMDLKKRKKSR